MSLSNVSVNRPVFATVMSLVIVLVGLISFFKLPVREYPDIDPPVVTVTTVYPGANSQVIESEITDIVEEELTGIEGIRTLTSTSRDQVSSISIEFQLERDIDLAAQDVRDKVARIRSRLPDESEEPVVAKADADAQPIMWIMVDSDTRNLLELSEYVDRNIKDHFQTIKGVSKVIFGGERRRSIQILIDPKKLAYHNLTVLDIDKALKDNNIELPSGRVLSTNKEFTINVYAKLKSVAEYERLIVKASNADSSISVIKLQDIATITEGPENDRSFVRFNGKQGFGLGIVRQAKSNTVEIAHLIKEKIRSLKTRMPADIKLGVGYDASTFINLSIQEVYKTILFASLLVMLIIFVFLGNFRSTVIPSVAIPISLIGVMAGLLSMNFTLNLMTLLGLIIAVGIVVDDSIIVLENIYRYIEEGMDPKEAAKKGANEITLAVIATTLVLIAIFLPIGFLSGITGRLLSEFAFALCFATIISSFVALTVGPMLCSKLLSHDVIVSKLEGQHKSMLQKIKSAIARFFQNIFIASERAYATAIAKAIQMRKTIVIASLLFCVLASAYCITVLPQDFIPNEDRGSFFTIIQAPRGSSLEYLDKQIRKVENILMQIPEMRVAIAVAAFGINAPGKVTEGIIINRLVDWDKRSKHVAGIVGPLYGILGQIPEAFILPIMPKSGPSSGFGSQPIEIVIKTNNVDFLVKASARITTEIKGLPSIMFARSNLSLDKPELKVDIDRDKARSLGVSMRDISRTLEILFTGIDLTEFNEDGENYQVIVQVPRDQKTTARKIGEIAVRAGTREGENASSASLLQLSNLIHVREVVAAEEISHHNRIKSATIGATPKPGFTAGEGLNQVEKLAREIVAEMKAEYEKENPNSIAVNDVEIDYIGTSKELKDSNIALYFGFMLALVFAYLFLAAQFESFVHPFTIMLTVPLAITGALLGLAFFQLFPLITNTAIAMGGPHWLQFVIPQFKNISLNIYSQVGIIMLIGMASKNGILLVEFINNLREQGMELEQAVVKAATLRLRPILMTAFSTVLGILPIAIALGVGTESRQSLGIAVIAGMTFSTFLTLFVVPCAYMLIDSWVTKKSSVD